AGAAQALFQRQGPRQARACARPRQEAARQARDREEAQLGARARTAATGQGIIACGARCAADGGCGASAKQKPRAKARGFCVIERVARSVPRAADLVVQAGAEDVVIELVAARRDIPASSTEGRLCERGVVVELDVEILALDRPAVAERVLIAGAHRPTGAGIALLMA